MPLELEGFENPHTLIEYRGIRGGERGEKAPIKTPLRVRMPTRNKDKKFDVDMLVMQAAAARLQVKDWVQVREIPILALTDKIMGQDGVVFVERALYTGRGRLCGSQAGDAKAQQYVSPKDYLSKGGKGVKILDRPCEVDCTRDCPLWLSDADRAKGKKSDCGWRAVVTVQLSDSLIYPSPSRMRTHSLYGIASLLTSLRFIAHVTGGILMGIPLWLRQSNIDVRDATGEYRKIPVTSFDFKGTIQELRAYAFKELQSRADLVGAHKGEWPQNAPALPSFVDQKLGGGEEIVEEPESTGDDEVAEDEIEKQRLIDVSTEVARLYKHLKYPPARCRAIEEKHQGDLDAVLAELKTLAPRPFDPSPGEAGNEALSPPEEKEPAGVADFLDDDLFT